MRRRIIGAIIGASIPVILIGIISGAAWLSTHLSANPIIQILLFVGLASVIIGAIVGACVD
jgi:hypothetical protein